ADEGLCDAEPLRHALRPPVHAPVPALGARDEFEQPRALLRAAARAGEPLVQLEHLVGRVPAREAEELGEVAERRARRLRPGSCAGDACLAAGGAHEADGDLDKRRLAGAVRPEQADELAFADGEVDAAQRLNRPVALLEIADGERVGHSGTMPRGY